MVHSLIGDTVLYRGKAWLVVGLYTDGKKGRVLILKAADGEETETNEKNVTRD